MTTHLKDDLPTIESGGLDDRTVASPALGFGQQRIDALPAERPVQAPQASGPGTFQSPSTPSEPSPWQESGQSPQSQDLLARNEVAAVSAQRPYYVSDMPSPYLTSRQAEEDVEDTRRRHGVRQAIVVALLVTALVAGGAWAILNALPKHEVMDVPQYHTTEIERGEFLDAVEAGALVEPLETQTVTAGASGNIQQSYVAEGSVVYAGDALFVLENKTVTESYDRAQKLYDDSVARVDEKRVKLDEANEAVTTSQEAVDKATQDTELTVAEAALTTAQTLQQSAKTEYEAAEATLETVTQTYDHALEQLEALTARAPISGTVTDVNSALKAGSAVSSSTQLCTVSDLSHYKLRVEIPIERRSMAAEGQQARVSFPEIDDLTITSTIASIEDTDGVSRATVVIDNADERIQTGMQATVSLVLQNLDDALIVPLEAVFMSEDGTTSLDVLLDPTRGIKTEVPVTVVAQSPTEAVVSAENIQAGNSVIIPE